MAVSERVGARTPADEYRRRVAGYSLGYDTAPSGPGGQLSLEEVDRLQRQLNPGVVWGVEKKLEVDTALKLGDLWPRCRKSWLELLAATTVRLLGTVWQRQLAGFLGV